MMKEREEIIRQLMDAEFHFMVHNIPQRWSIIDAWGVYERNKKTDDAHALGILAECYSILAPYENEIIEYDLEFINNSIQNTSLVILRKICNEYHVRQVALKAYGLIPEPQPQAPVKTGQKVKRHPTAAAQRLQSQELQAVKEKLTQAGIIINGEWAGSPAEFGELVRWLEAQREIQNGRGKAWSDIAKWAGYPKERIKSAQNAIEGNAGEVQSIKAEIIRKACLK